jgi:acetyl esterase
LYDGKPHFNGSSPALKTFLPQFPQLTPAMRSVLQRMARASRPPLHTQPASAAKAAYELGAGILEVPKAELARVEDFEVPARDGHRLPARLYAPSGGVLPVLLYFHGGGFTVGSIASHDILCRELSRLGGCAVVSLDYRLAPEHRFPVAANDAWDATQWLAAHAASLGLDGARLAVGGDSAGGTLAAVCAILARDTGLRLALQLLFYPGCAAWQDAPSHERFGQGLVLEKAHIEWFFDQYIARSDREDWRFAPLNAADVDSVAPAWFGLAECDPLVDDGLAYADKLRAAGVAVDLEIYRGVTHEFIKMGRAIPQARQAHADAARALALALRP